MKKNLLLTLFALVCAITCVFGITACDSGNGTDTEPEPVTNLHSDHMVEHIPARDATDCYIGGNIEYWFCHDCQAYFADSDCKTEVTEKEIDITSQHPLSDYWDNDNEYHWHTVLCRHRNETGVKIKHNIVNGKCTECAYAEQNFYAFIPNQDGTGYTVTGFDYPELSALTDDSDEHYIPDGFNRNGFYLNIPSSYNEKPVTEIADNAFSDLSSMSSLIIYIPDTIKRIGRNAFTYQSDSYKSTPRIIKLTIGSGVEEIGENAFTLPDKGTNIYEIHNKSEITFDIHCSTQYTGKDEDHYYGFGGSTVHYKDGYIYIYGGRYIDAEDPAGLIGYIGNETELVLPNDFNGLTYSIESDAFRGYTELKSISMTNGVTDIGSSAFQDCRGLESIVFSTTLERIYGSAFYNCEKLTNIEMPNSIKNLGDNAFAGCSQLTTVSLSEGLTVIPYGCFAGCGLTEVVVPDGVTSIEIRAFENCYRLIRITVGRGVTDIENWAFNNNHLLEIENLSELEFTKGSNVYGCIAQEVKNVYTSTKGKSKFVTHNNYTFYDDETTPILVSYSGNESYLELPETFKGKAYKIYSFAFYNHTELKNISVPNNIMDIDSSAFYGCTIETASISVDYIWALPYETLKNINITSGEIVRDTFRSYSKLTSITISDDVTNVDRWAFTDTVWYQNQPDGLIYVDKVALGYKGEMPNETKVTLKDDTVRIAAHAFAFCENLKEVCIPASVVAIGDGAFAECSGLETVTISGDVETIGSYVFENCRALTNITIPDTVTSIGNKVFWGCTNLKTIRAPLAALNGISTENLEEITITGEGRLNNDLFANANQLKKVTIGSNITIAQGAFSGCSNIESITLPLQYQLGYIFGKTAFNGASATEQVVSLSGGYLYTDTYYIPDKLTNVTVNGGEIKFGAFSRCVNLTSVILADTFDSNNISMYSFYECTGLENIILSDSIQVLDQGAFSGCSKLSQIDLKSVKIIYGLAFEKCTSLIEITMPASMASVNGRAFDGCTSLTKITFAAPNSWYYVTVTGDEPTVQEADLSNPATNVALFKNSNYTYAKHTV